MMSARMEMKQILMMRLHNMLITIWISPYSSLSSLSSFRIAKGIVKLRKVSKEEHFGLKRNANGECMLHNEELYSLYRSPNKVRVVESRRLR